MLDNLTRWPLRIGILGAVVSANVAGDCGRSTYLANGGAGVAAPSLMGPVYKGRDTAQLTATASVGQGAAFNPGDANELRYVGIERNWANESIGWGFGALGYQGAYTTSQQYFTTNSRFTYQGLGGNVHLYHHLRSGRVENRVGAQLGYFREWGQWPDFRSQIPSSQVRSNFRQLGSTDQHACIRLDAAVQSIPRRKWSPTIGGGFYGVITQGRFGVGLHLTAGSGPIRANMGLLTLGGSAPFQFGLSVGMPPYQRR